MAERVGENRITSKRWPLSQSTFSEISNISLGRRNSGAFIMPISCNDQTATLDPNRTCFPVANSLTSFWQTDKHPLSDHRSTFDLPAQSDIVIIGAGYAGVSTAHHLLQELGDAAPSITILEARGICSGATGRNGGHLRPDLYGHIPTYIERAGPRAGAEIAEFEIANLRALKRFIEEEEIDCDFTLARSIDVWCNEDAAKKAKATYDVMKAHQFEYMDDVVFYTRDQAEAVSRSRYLFSWIWWQN